MSVFFFFFCFENFWGGGGAVACPPLRTALATVYEGLKLFKDYCPISSSGPSQWNVMLCKSLRFLFPPPYSLVTTLWMSWCLGTYCCRHHPINTSASKSKSSTSTRTTMSRLTMAIWRSSSSQSRWRSRTMWDPSASQTNSRRIGDVRSPAGVERLKQVYMVLKFSVLFQRYKVYLRDIYEYQSYIWMITFECIVNSARLPVTNVFLCIRFT